MKIMYVYILKCADNSYYTGVTNNLDKRINEHDEGYNPKCYTFNRRPLSLVFHQRFTDPLLAIAFEKKLKGWSRAKKEALIDGDWEKIRHLANYKKDKPYTETNS